MYVFFTKQIVHVACALGIWVFVLVLMLMEQNNPITLKIDQIKLYSLRKIPAVWDVSFSLLTSSLQTQWTPADDLSCMQRTVLAQSSTHLIGGTTAFMTTSAQSVLDRDTIQACKIKRVGIVNTVRQTTSCDQYRSAFCNCVNQMLQPIANDLSGTLQTNVFSDVGKNVAGNLTSLLTGTEACHYMHHGTFIAQQTGNTWLRRTHLLFILSTIVTGNAFYHFIVLPYCHGYFLWGITKLLRVVGILIWPAVGAVTALMQESGTQNIILWLLIPPVILLLWYEFLLPRLRFDPFIHPYTFAVIQCILVLASLADSHILDYDIYWTEIWKSHLISCLYFGVCWFHLFLDNDDTNKKSYYRKHAQETIYISIVLGVLVAFNTVMAPYTCSVSFSLLRVMPGIFVFAAFASVIWMCQNDRFSDFHSDMKQEEYKRMILKPGYIVTSDLYLSCILLVIVALHAVYYWRDFAHIVFSVWQKIPTNSIQVQSNTGWLNPVF